MSRQSTVISRKMMRHLGIVLGHLAKPDRNGDQLLVVPELVTLILVFVSIPSRLSR
jgi:hypothetical protein